ncbi:MAG: hypothetical protein ACKERG_04040 [Candidatus Hodgkinia cicadicola]
MNWAEVAVEAKKCFECWAAVIAVVGWIGVGVLRIGGGRWVKKLFSVLRLGVSC